MSSEVIKVDPEKHSVELMHNNSKHKVYCLHCMEDDAKRGTDHRFMSSRKVPKELPDLVPLIPSMTVNEMAQVMDRNLFTRMSWMRNSIDPRRDLDEECGYPYFITPRQYRFMYDREGISKRACDIYADECFASDLEIKEDETPQDTELEAAYKELISNENTDLVHYWHRVDVQSGIQRYGSLLLGFNDGKDLMQPVNGVDDSETPSKSGSFLKLNFIRCFDEDNMHVLAIENNPNSPRYSKPLYYHAMLGDVSTFGTGNPDLTQAISQRAVHWTRVIHVADNRQGSEIYGVPRQQPIFNRLCDVRKILGGSAEMFWKGGFPGYSFELTPELQAAGVEFGPEEKKELKQQFFDYCNGLQRFLAVVGLQTKSLAPQVANPQGNLEAQMMAIAVSLGVPLRIFTGSEQAQLASGQDVRTWNRRLVRRQNRYLTPCLIRPTLNRLIAAGVLPAPRKAYKVLWPDVDMPNDDLKSQITERITTALMKYVTGAVYQIMPLVPYLVNVCGFTQELADNLYAQLQKNPNPLDIKVPAVLQAEVQPPKDPNIKPGGYNNG